MPEQCFLSWARDSKRAYLRAHSVLVLEDWQMRVEIPAYTDRWMMGDRYGDVVLTGRLRNAKGVLSDIVKVKLDKSGKTVRVWLDDCKVL